MKHDYETDPRSFADCLKDFSLRINGGSAYGSRQKAAEELRVPATRINDWMLGRTCPYEQAFRRQMTLISEMTRR
ncbi:hypothetical protein [Brucella sp. IR073]|uniref:hypothetical protein n=1 Tax=unclassified Brucella TaxID=2632610 RepID=UPI003B98045C